MPSYIWSYQILLSGRHGSGFTLFSLSSSLGAANGHLILCQSSHKGLQSSSSNARAQVDDEDAAVMNLIKSDDWVVMLDENGQDIGSEQMAELVGDAGNTGASRLSFCIGGPYGHGRQLRKRANLSIKLSTLVLNHQIAVLVLMEQLYRSWTILKGQKYHH